MKEILQALPQGYTMKIGQLEVRKHKGFYYGYSQGIYRLSFGEDELNTCVSWLSNELFKPIFIVNVYVVTIADWRKLSIASNYLKMPIFLCGSQVVVSMIASPALNTMYQLAFDNLSHRDTFTDAIDGLRFDYIYGLQNADMEISITNS